MTVLRHLGKREWLLSTLAIITIISQVFLDLRLIDYMQTITEMIVEPSASVSGVLIEGAKMLGCAAGSMVAAIITGYCMAMIGATVVRNLRQAVFTKAISLPEADFEHFGAPSLITRSTNDVTQVQMFVVMGCQMMVKAPILTIWAIIKIAGKNLNWTVATGVAALILLVMIFIIWRIVMPRMMRMQRITDDLNRVTREHMEGVRVIRAYGSQDFHQKRFEATNTELTNTHLMVSGTFSFMMPIMNTVISGLNLAIYVLGAFMISAAAGAEKITLFSQMIVFSGYATQAIGGFLMMAMVFVFAPRAIVANRRIREVLDCEPSLVEAAATGDESARVLRKEISRDLPEPAIEFRDVSFSYPGAEKDALHQINLKIPRGQTIALIGATGSGKTSLVNLIPRVYDPREGQVLVNGKDVREWRLHDLRNQIAYSPQKITLFTGTIASNIAFGEGPKDITPADIVKAGDTAACDFIADKEGEFAAEVAQGGSNFSGGQKQRISIARTVARDAQILIFDDTFSALDYATDRDIRGELAEKARGKTQIIVAQRIATVREADQILVIDHGKIAERGTHESLMASSKIYREIALSQLSEEELA
ncbi:ABC transporter ATP-binding protein [Varibaculum cambriense]|uniref:ABC transporter ATP-binding protein n=1 Tax=Varibaculum cambriense TaxID=184870 RepID=UPI002901B36C|nr:ABC transporter ATP-binding protein [Varibaculum cambriense]MDU1223648.1 ABC transporter ATP-binding protein [Varibaculum cambriense]